jgi:hypothetical protein
MDCSLVQRSLTKIFILRRLRNLRCQAAKVLTRTVDPLMMMMMMNTHVDSVFIVKRTTTVGSPFL